MKHSEVSSEKRKLKQYDNSDTIIYFLSKLINWNYWLTKITAIIVGLFMVAMGGYFQVLSSYLQPDELRILARRLGIGICILGIIIVVLMFLGSLSR